MRRISVGVFFVFAIASSAFGQGSQHPCPGAFNLQGFDDGGSERIWKIANPSGPSEWFNVDFDNMLSSGSLIGLAVAFDESSQAKPASWDRIGLYGDNLTVDPAGNTPDVSAPLLAGYEISQTGITVYDQNCRFGVYTGPVTDLATAGLPNSHVAFKHDSGDSAMWLCSDTSSPSTGRSFFTSTNYASPASSFTINWMLRAAVIPTGTLAGDLLVSGGSSFVYSGPAATIEQLQNVNLQFWGNKGDLAALFTAPPLPVAKVGPILPVGFNGMTNRDWILCGQIECNAPVGFPLTFNAFYLESETSTILKSNTVTLTVTSNPAGCGFCYGQLDDGAFDGFVFRVSNPSGSNDWFNVHHGVPSPASGVNTVTGVELATWDFCGTGGTGSWAEVGVYPADFVLSSAGNFPDLGNPLATVGGASAPVSPGVADWGYPSSFYDTADVAAGGDLHAAVMWNATDSCIWMASDTTSTGPDPCGTLPNTTSYSSPDGYAATAGAATSINWMMKLDWQ